jgi:hypothetical protein
MALQEVALPVAFSGGVETRQDPKQVPTAKLIDLQNGVFTRATSIAKRNGYQSLGTAIEGSGVVYRDPAALAARGDELILFAGDRSYSRRAQADAWSDAGPVSSVLATETPLVRTATIQSLPDAATAAGVTVVAWEDSRGGVWWAIVEVATGRIVRAAAQASATGGRPRCLPVGSVLHVLWSDDNFGTLNVIVVDPVTLGVSAPQVLTSDVDTSNPAYDACVTNVFGGAALLAWSSLGVNYRVGYLDPAGVLGSPAAGYPSVGTFGSLVDTSGIAIDFNTAGVAAPANIVVVVDNGTTNVRMIDSATLTETAFRSFGAGTVVRLAVAFDAVTAPNDGFPGGCLYVWRELSTAGPRQATVEVWLWSGLGPEVLQQRGTIYGAGLASRAFRDASGPCVWVVRDTTFFAVYLCMRQKVGSAADCVSRTMPGVATGRPPLAHLPSVHGDGTRIHTATLPYHERLDTPTGAAFAESAIRLVALDFDADEAWQTAQLGRGLYLAAACPQHYDGDRWTEWGFHYAPDDVAAPVKAAGGSMSVSSTYNYLFNYEWTDAQGEIHRGAVSSGTVVVMGGADTQVTIAFPMLRITGKERVRGAVWRTLPGDASVYRRVSSVNPSATGPNGYILNDPTVDTISFVDRMSDATWQAQEPLYINGGISSNDPAPMAGSVICAGKGRLFWTDPSDGNLVRFSQQLAEGYAAEPVARLLLRVDPDGGPITGLGVMDDVVIVFKETAIYVFGGPGPLANPDFGGDTFAFTAPALIPTDVGCITPQSIAKTPLGLTFKSQRGIGLVTRDRQVANIGAPIELYASQVCTRATLLPDRSQIVFLTSEGRTLLFDFEHGQWSTFTNHEGFDGIVVGGLYHYLRNDGRVFQETPGVYADGAAQITMVLETAWVKLAGYLQGWQQVHSALFLGTYKSPHTLRVEVQLDYEDGFGAPFDIDVDADYNPSLYGSGSYGAGPYGSDPASSTRYQREIHIGMESQGIRFRLSDLADVGVFGASFELSEMLITGGILASSYRLPATRRS